MTMTGGVVTKKCEHCGSAYQRTPSRANSSRFCSAQCHSKSMETSILTRCKNCGEQFRVQPARASFTRYCSNSCRYNHNTGERAPNFSGNRFLCSERGVVHINIGGNTWVYEHRKLVEDRIGRKLLPNDEPIIHINGVKSDNRLSNLYVCMNRSEFATMHLSYKPPYPVESNIESLVGSKVPQGISRGPATCETCGGIFRPRMNRGSLTRFCSRKCIKR
jgi:hypothetical protein